MALTVPRPRTLVTILLLLLVGAVAVAFVLLAETQPNIPDTIGYVYAGERLAAGQGLTYEDARNETITPYFSLYAFQIRRPGDPRMFLGFPPGFPLLLAAGIMVGGPAVAPFVVPLLAALALVVAFYLGFLLSDDRWVGLWTAVFLAFTPLFWQFGTAAWSEVPATLFVMAGVCFYLLSRQEKRPLRHKLFFSLLAGILLIYSFFIRYANVTILPALGLYELYTGRAGVLTQRWRWAFYALLAAGLAGMVLFNQVYYGGATLTSYSPQHGWYPYPAFSFSYALGPSFVDGYSLRESLKTAWRNFPLLLLLAPPGWVGLKRPSGLLAVTATLSGLVLYAVYAFAPAGINGRFLLPIFPFIAAGIAQALMSIGARLPHSAWRWAGGAALLLALSLPLPGRVAALVARNESNARDVAAIRALTAQTTADAVFLSYHFNDQIIVYGPRSALNYRRIPVSDPAAGRYRKEMLEPCLVQAVGQMVAQGIPVYYVAENTPPSWDVLPLLETYFTLEPLPGAPQTVRIQALKRELPDGASSCAPAVPGVADG